MSIAALARDIARLTDTIRYLSDDPAKPGIAGPVLRIEVPVERWARLRTALLAHRTLWAVAMQDGRQRREGEFEVMGVKIVCGPVGPVLSGADAAPAAATSEGQE